MIAIALVIVTTQLGFSFPLQTDHRLSVIPGLRLSIVPELMDQIYTISNMYSSIFYKLMRAMDFNVKVFVPGMEADLIVSLC